MVEGKYRIEAERATGRMRSIHFVDGGVLWRNIVLPTSIFFMFMLYYHHFGGNLAVAASTRCMRFKFFD